MEGLNDSMPEHYFMMIPRFKIGFNILEDPRNAFIPGTPQWMIDEWHSYAECQIETI